MENKEVQPETTDTQNETAEIPKDLLEHFVKRGLFKLDSMDREDQGFKERAEARLSSVEDDLKKLEASYPQDSDVKVLREMYEDLRRDFEQTFSMDFDSSFDLIVEEMEQELETSGVRKETPEDSILAETVQSLETVGIHPSYVVTQGDPTAPTIVLYMMAHSNPGMDQELRDLVGITRSQDDIYKGIKAAHAAGLIDTVYTEGWGEGHEMDLKEGNLRDAVTADENAMAMGAFRLETELGDELTLVGTEDMPLLMSAWKGNGMEYRATAQNVLIADNIADNVKTRQESLSVLTFGAMHESFDLGPEDERRKHPVPLSSLLAYNGVNVIVVDATTPYANFSPEAQEKLSRLRIAKSTKEKGAPEEDSTKPVEEVTENQIDAALQQLEGNSDAITSF